jgi:hypothetical protein
LFPRILNLSERSTLALNITQAAGMFSFAFGVPLVIGIKEYGLYSACFAVPATLSILWHNYFLSIIPFNEHQHSRLHYAIFTITSLLLLFIIYFIFKGGFEFFLSVIIFFALVLRVYIETNLLCHSRDKYLFALIRVESISIFANCLWLSFFFFTELKSAMMPVGMLLSGFAILVVLTCRHIQPIKFKTQPFIFNSGSIPSLMKRLSLRVHEEGFVTNMPLFISSVANNELAGQFRLGLSFAKAMSKFFPYRLEWIYVSLADGSIDKVRISRIWIVFSLGYYAVTGLLTLLLYFSGLYAIPLSFALMLISAPPVAFLLLFTPSAVERSRSLIYFVLCSLVVCVATSSKEDLMLLSVAFVSTQFLLVPLVFKVIFTSK